MKARNLLVNAPLIMLSRRVADLGRFKKTMAAHRWPILGNERTCVVYKAGKVLLAFYAADGDLSPGSFVGGDGKSSFLIHNAASSIVIAVPDIRKVIDNLAKCECITADCAESLSSGGSTFSYVDDYGNSTIFWQNNQGTRARKVDPGTGDRRPIRGAARNNDQTHRLSGVHLLVADLQRSVQFYHHVLGLKLIESNRDSAMLNISTLTLTLTVEPVCGLVASLNRSQRLSGDRITFAVTDIERVVQSLLTQGITSSASIEEPLIGRRDLISDPDGRLITLWEQRDHIRSPKYYTQLGRQLVAQSEERAAELDMS